MKSTVKVGVIVSAVLGAIGAARLCADLDERTRVLTPAEASTLYGGQWAINLECESVACCADLFSGVCQDYLKKEDCNGKKEDDQHGGGSDCTKFHNGWKCSTWGLYACRDSYDCVWVQELVKCTRQLSFVCFAPTACISGPA